jgi:hypothetical protein
VWSWLEFEKSPGRKPARGVAETVPAPSASFNFPVRWRRPSLEIVLHLGVVYGLLVENQPG